MANVAFTTPHRTATEIGLQFLKEGAHAVDAMVAAAAAISVVYPHMNGIGGDSFWIIQAAGQRPLAIDASGVSAAGISADHYHLRELRQIPARGPDACVTLGGTVSGWQYARDLAGKVSQKPNVPLKNLLAPATQLAKSGVPITDSLAGAIKKASEEIGVAVQTNGVERSVFDCFKQIFIPDGEQLKKGEIYTNAALAQTFEQLAHAGLDDFYRGELARVICDELKNIGSLITQEDFKHYRARCVEPLQTNIRYGQIFNLPPPTQGLASLLILAIYDRLYDESYNEALRAHFLIEATKQAFKIRDNTICDPSKVVMPVDNFLTDDYVTKLLDKISLKAEPWPQVAEPGDTVWMGCIDRDGLMVSFIQSIYWEFGAGVAIPGTGIVWNNRGSSFSLDKNHRNALGPGLKPLHTLNPAYAQLKGGHRVIYGTMGGDGQPQTQAALFTRKFYDDMSLEDSINRGRWLLGRTWGAQTADLKMEQDLYQIIGNELESMGHKITVVPSQNEIMGHAGAIVVNRKGELECAYDRRSDGAAMIA